MVFSMMKSLLFFTIITNPLIPPFPDWNFGPFYLDVFDTCECEAHFRVAKDDIPVLLNALRIPASFKCPQGTVCSGFKDYVYLVYLPVCKSAVCVCRTNGQRRYRLNITQQYVFFPFLARPKPLPEKCFL